MRSHCPVRALVEGHVTLTYKESSAMDSHQRLHWRGLLAWAEFVLPLPECDRRCSEVATMKAGVH